MPPREVGFVKYYQKGSTDIAADQMAAALLQRGIAARSLPAADLGDVRDALLVFVKRADLVHLLAARRRGCKLLLDVQDTVVFKRGVRFRQLWDGILFRNRRALEDFGRRGRDVEIPQHWDQRYRPHDGDGDGLRLAFIGDPRSFPFAGGLPGVTPVFDDWFARAPGFNAHLSVRRPGREFLYKPNNKVVTAAACAAVLLTTPDASALEHLGAEYPFYVGGERDEVILAIRRAEAVVGGAAWQRALAILACVREQTTLERTTDLYLDYFARFGELAAAAT